MKKCKKGYKNIEGKCIKQKTKCKNIEIKPSKNFKDMYAIYVNGKIFDEPHASKRLAQNQVKRFKGVFKCK